jgi:trigger factor
MKNEDISIKLEKKAGCLVELEVKVLSSFIQAAKKEALKDLKKEIDFPGFRKGKAPDSIIFKKYPKAFEETWHKKLADISFIKANEKEKLPILYSESKIIFNMKEILEDGATLTYSYESEPEIPKVEPKDFHLKELTQHEITDKELDEALRQSQFFFANWKNIEDRPVQIGDYLILDVEAIDSHPHQKVLSDVRFEVSEKSMTQWMKNIVLGAKLNDAIEGISAPDDNATEEEKKEFTPKKVRVTIKKIEEATLPELNDEFAKKMGSTSIEALKKAIFEMLSRREEEHVLKEKRNQVIHFLTESYHFDLPSSLLETEIKSRKERSLKDSEFKDHWDKLSEEEKIKLDEEIAKQAEQALRLFYLTRTIIQKNGIKISNEEIKNEALYMLHQAGKYVEEKDISKDTYAMALSHLVLTKAEDYILEHSLKN